MGSTNSCLGSRTRRSSRPKFTKRILSSLFICGGASTSPAPVEMEDDPAELLVRAAEDKDPVSGKFRNSTEELVSTSGTGHGFTRPKIETAFLSENTMAGSDDFSFEDDGSGSFKMSNNGKCLSESKELVPSYRLSVDNSSDGASSSYADPNFANGRVNMHFVNTTDSVVDKDMSQISFGVVQSSTLSPHPDGMAVEHHGSELTVMHESDSGSASVVSHSTITLDSLSDDTLQEAIIPGVRSLVSEREEGQRDEGVVHVDVVSLSPNILSSGTAEINTRESRRNSRRLFWDAFSRRGTRRHSDSRTFILSTDDSDDLGSNDRWLLDFGGDFFDDGLGGDNRYLGSRSHNLNEGRRHSRSEVWERLQGGIDPQSRICPSGLHPDGRCSCESILRSENSAPHASISRIVMLAEALFEVLDEIHRQPMSLSSSMVSLPAPEFVVDSLPVKSHRNKHNSGSDVEQCNICLADYDEGDKIRVLPCQHEYHMSCVDKWLKEIQGVCPLCRGDVRETEASISNPEIHSS